MKARVSLALGIDVGTSGVRVAVLDAGGDVVAEAGVKMPAAPQPARPGRSAAWDWFDATESALGAISAKVSLRTVEAFAVDGTSGTLVAVDAVLQPVAPPSLYNDPCQPEILDRIKTCAPPHCAALGATSALGRAIELQVREPYRILHQADWIGALLSGRFGATDENNALKTGYDPLARCWPAWLRDAGMDTGLLPDVVPAGSVLASGPMSKLARALGFQEPMAWIAGTTDGCAAFLATGASRPGEGVTSLGSTLVLKVLSDGPVFAPAYGIYSHRVGDLWLAGGASNTGGAALLEHFSVEQMMALEPRIDPDHELGLGFYPLPGVGERFPLHDPEMVSRVTPRPAGEADFLQALLEGIADIEALGYRRLAEVGATKVTSVRTVGGGASNTAWSQLRQRRLAVPFLSAHSQAAAAGVARLALRALR